MTVTDEQVARYDELFGGKNYSTFEEYEAALNAMEDPDKAAFYTIFINDVITGFTNGFLRYENLDGSQDIISLLERYLKKVDDSFAEAFLAFLKGQHKRCIDYLTKSNTLNGGKTSTETDFLYGILGPFKNAFPGFYSAIRKSCDNLPTDELARLLCEQMDAFYATEDPDQMAEAIYPILQKYPDSVVANLLLGYTHYEAKRWGSAIACFEKIEEKTTNSLFWDDEIWFFKAWSYGKLREHQNAIKCYEKVLELYPDSENTLNNMGYEYYLMKQYSKAIRIFKRCLDEDRDVKYAANNYVRALLAAGKNTEAKAFVAEGKYKITPEMQRRVKAVGKDKIVEPIVDEDAVDGSYNAEDRPTRKNADQFSSEKLLEDELSLRIDAGFPVFGKQLKIYRRHGEYGRQYIIPVGRLDLLAEDNNGDLYIIELKKDSGYDDPYDQTAAYLDWFEKNHRKKSQKIYGIICLNGPSKSLVEKVRNDERIQLFNYSISYDEVK